MERAASPSPHASHPGPIAIRLRPTTAQDLPFLHAFQADPESNRLAGIKPDGWGTLAAYTARWENVLRDPAITPRVILLDDAVVGTINVAPSDGVPALGYWVARDHWGRGIATRAITLFLAEYTLRPLYARAWVQNVPSIRAMERCGFTVTGRIMTPETPKAHAREMTLLTLV